MMVHLPFKDKKECIHIDSSGEGYVLVKLELLIYALGARKALKKYVDLDKSICGIDKLNLHVFLIRTVSKIPVKHFIDFIGCASRRFCVKM